VQAAISTSAETGSAEPHGSESLRDSHCSASQRESAATWFHRIECERCALGLKFDLAGLQPATTLADHQHRLARCSAQTDDYRKGTMLTLCLRRESRQVERRSLIGRPAASSDPLVTDSIPGKTPALPRMAWSLTAGDDQDPVPRIWRSRYRRRDCG